MAFSYPNEILSTPHQHPPPTPTPSDNPKKMHSFPQKISNTKFGNSYKLNELLQFVMFDLHALHVIIKPAKQPS